MQSISSQLFLPYFHKIGLYKGDNSHNTRGCGLYYELDPKIGKGYYWLYPVKDLYAVTVYDFIFKCDTSINFQDTSFIHLGNYSPACAKMMSKNVSEKTDDNLLGYVGRERTYVEKIQHDAEYRNIGISLMPKFYERLLSIGFSKSSKELINICSKLDGKFNIPEVIAALKQIAGFKAPNNIAAMYYESKIIEIISLVMQWNLNEGIFIPKDSNLQWELEGLQKAYSYIDKNYTKHIPLDILSKISCMSSSKLTSSFKKIYGVTITEHIQDMRIKRAKEMLLNSNWDIKKIAQEVGYKLHGSFSELFKRETGFTPKEFRNQLF